VSPASLQNVLATSAYVLFYEITRQSRDELLARYFMFSSVFRIRRIQRIHMFLGLPDLDPVVRDMDPDLAPDPSIVRKTLIPTVL
jgi:hypothetical protein